MLAALEVELVDAGGGTGGEVADPSSQLVVGHELVALRSQVPPTLCEFLPAGVDVAASLLNLGQFQ